MLAENQSPEADQDRAFWSYVDLAWLIGIMTAFFLVLMILTAALVSFHPALKESGPFVLGMQLVIYAALYLAFVYIFQVRHKQPVMRSLGWRPSHFGVGASLGAGALLAIVVELLASLLKTPEKSPIEQFTNTPLSLFLVSVIAVGFAPLFEELFFRGFIQPLLTRDLGAIAGIIISGTLFGALHLFEYGNAWQYGLAISLVGIVLGAIRYRAKSVVPGTLVHACFNSIAVIALIASKFHKLP